MVGTRDPELPGKSLWLWFLVSLKVSSNENCFMVRIRDHPELLGKFL